MRVRLRLFGRTVFSVTVDTGPAAVPGGEALQPLTAVAEQAEPYSPDDRYRYDEDGFGFKTPARR